MIDDMAAQLRQPVNIGFPCPEIAALDGIVKQTPGAVAVVGVILGRVDSALGRDAVGPTGAVLDAEAFNVISQFRQTGRG